MLLPVRLLARRAAIIYLYTGELGSPTDHVYTSATGPFAALTALHLEARPSDYFTTSRVASFPQWPEISIQLRDLFDLEDASMIGAECDVLVNASVPLVA